MRCAIAAAAIATHAAQRLLWRARVLARAVTNFCAAGARVTTAARRATAAWTGCRMVRMVCEGVCGSGLTVLALSDRWFLDRLAGG